jgi:hypothetical protein
MKRFLCLATGLFPLFAASLSSAAPKPLITYFQPMPIVGKLSTTVWGAATVGARDPGNGLEDNGKYGGVGPRQETNFYWDGKIVKGEDGKYHLYGSRWVYSNGFGPPVGPSGSGWQSSVPIQAISDGVMGPYVVQGDCYAKNQEGNNKGHNTTALVAPTGATPYTLSVGEIVAGQMFASASANGPWTLIGLTSTNSNGHNGCGSLASNFTFTVGPGNRFWATSRSGCVMDSDQALGPYKVETDSVLPNLENNDNGNAEDEVIWYSGGYFHIVYNYWNFQRAYHIMSKDGLKGWMSTGLAYQGTQAPANANSNWLRYTDGTVNQWHNLERPGVYEENGHVTHFTFAVTDVDKNTSAVNMGGSKILVVPFNGVQFDCDNGDAASCDELTQGHGGGGGGGTGGAQGGTGGTNAHGGAPSGSAGFTAASGDGGNLGIAGAGGQAASGGGTGGTGGGAPSGGSMATGGLPSGAAGHGVSGTAGGGNGGTPADTDSGCSCRVSSTKGRSLSGLLLLSAMLCLQRRRTATRRGSDRQKRNRKNARH